MSDLGSTSSTSLNDHQSRDASQERHRDVPVLASALDSIATPVLLTDRDLNITYLNIAGRRCLAAVASAAGRPSEVNGHNLSEVFSEFAALTSALDPALPCRRTLRLGAESVEAEASLLRDEAGERVGVMLSWTPTAASAGWEITPEVAMSAVEQAPFNMLVTDRNLRVTFANARSRDALRHLAGDLPIDPETIVGSLLDEVFDKPSGWRGSVNAVPSMLQSGRILLGDDVIDVSVTPLSDASGDATGGIVSWRVATDNVKRELDRVASEADVVAANRVEAGVAAATTREQAIMIAIQRVREEFGWAYGSFWEVSSEGVLRFAADSGDAGEEFRRVTLEATFAEGVGLSGRAWAARDVIFTRDLGQMVDCVRAPVALEVGIKSGVCFPIIVRGEVIGTMDFFVTDTVELSSQRLNVLRSVGRLVSGAFERIALQEAERRAQEALADRVGTILEVVRAAAGGDLTRSVDITGDDEAAEVGRAINIMLDQQRQSVAEIGGLARDLSTASSQLADVSLEMDRGALSTAEQAGAARDAASEVSASIRSAAASIEMMNTSIVEIARSAADAADVAGSAVTVAASAQETIRQLGDSSVEIGHVVQTIEIIARQSNLLALNARIEAARAGDAGKSFVVVASAMKELADQTANATRDIGRRIEAIQSDARGTVEVIAEMSTVIGRISTIQGEIATSVDDQSQTSRTLARDVAGAASGATSIAEGVAQVAGSAAATRQGAQTSLTSATDLTQMAGRMGTLVDRFEY